MSTDTERQKKVCIQLNMFGWMAVNPLNAEPLPEILVGEPVVMRLRRSPNFILVNTAGTVHNYVYTGDSKQF